MNDLERRILKRRFLILNIATPIAFVVILIFAVISLLEVTSRLSAEECFESWKDSGMESRYVRRAGCQVKTDSGFWIPAENFREI